MRQRKQSYNTIFMWFDNLPISTKLKEFFYYHGKI